MQRKLVAVCAILLLSAVGLISQGPASGPHATITGTVTDQTGAVVANVPVAVTNADTKAVVTSNTSSTGNYSVTGLTSGKHTLTIEMPGFKKYSRENITLLGGQVLRQDVQLELGTVSDTIIVTPTTTVLQIDSAEITHRISLEDMRRLPPYEFGFDGTTNLRDPYTTAGMLPG